MSQPLPKLEYPEPELDTSAAGRPFKRHRSTGAVLSDKEIQELLEKFENNMELYLLGINLVEPENTEVTITAKIDKLLLMYTIGRCNPPHEGHIQLFIKTIEEAKKQDASLTTRVIFFLGSGPNGGERTSKDPLDFKTKKTVIEYLLSNRGRGYTPYQSDGSGDYEIREKDYKDAGQMITPTVQLVDTVRRLGLTNEFNEIQSQLIVGNKDDDSTKLNYMLKSFKTNILTKFPELSEEDVTSEIITIEPIQGATGDLSATAIRKLAWESKTLEEFKYKTNYFYGAMAETVYEGINAHPPELDWIEPKRRLKKGGSRLKGTKKGTKRRLKKGTKKGTKRRLKKGTKKE